LKQWPLERFGELANRLRETSPTARFLLVGGPEDREKCRVVAEAVGESAINLAGKTSLRELTALLRRCTLFIGNDTGAMHISAAVDLPVIALFGPTCAHRYAPWSGHTVLQIPLACSPCQQPDHPHRCLSCPYEQPLCLQQLTVERVVEAARTRLVRAEPVNIR
jgi:ADP-heptose:LPS heptosyltransferase